jgi:hypothetical protein
MSLQRWPASTKEYECDAAVGDTRVVKRACIIHTVICQENVGAKIAREGSLICSFARHATGWESVWRAGGILGRGWGRVPEEAWRGKSKDSAFQSCATAFGRYCLALAGVQYEHPHR